MSRSIPDVTRLTAPDGGTGPAERTSVPARNGGNNALQKEDLSVHGWYRFVLSFPPHLVRRYLTTFELGADDLVLDPFCGTGTTVVEAKKQRVPSLGCDAHPFAALVSRVKTTWDLEAKTLRSVLKRILRQAEVRSSEHGLEALSFEASLLQDDPLGVTDRLQLTEEEQKLLPTGFLSQRPLRRLLILRDELDRQARPHSPAIHEFFLLALAHVAANGAGNFAFGPEIYRTKPKPDYDVLGHFARHADWMISALVEIQASTAVATPATVVCTDSRRLDGIPAGISAVITSPPYPNEKDYTRTTRVESILLRILTSRESLREVKESLLRSNTRNVFADDTDGAEVAEFASIRAVCEAIEKRRIELAKDSGFERLYHKVVSHYFGGMRRHLRALRPKLTRRARLAYVVGDQLSFLMVPVATARLLSEVAAAEGYKAIGCELWRERVGTKVRNSLTQERTVRIREEILVLEKG